MVGGELEGCEPSVGGRAQRVERVCRGVGDSEWERCLVVCAFSVWRGDETCELVEACERTRGNETRMSCSRGPCSGSGGERIDGGGDGCATCEWTPGGA